MRDNPNLMRTFTGHMVDPCNVKVSDIRILDVAHHLSMICRFGGAIPTHYSVAQHSCLVSVILAANGFGKDVLWAGLLHDVPEYLLGDCVSPFKRRLPAYNFYEDKLWATVVERFNIADDDDARQLVKEADYLAYQIEANTFQERGLVYDGGSLSVPSCLILRALPAHEAKLVFIRTFATLIHGR